MTTIPASAAARPASPPARARARALAGTLPAAAFVFFLAMVCRSAWLADDAYITFRTVDNFIHGYGLRYNIAERVQSFTHPLWMLLYAGAHLLTHEPYYCLIALSLLTSALAVGLAARQLAAAPLGAAVGIAALGLSKAFVDYSTGGLENPLTHLLLTLFLIVYLKAAPDRRSDTRLALLTALVALSRLDAILLVLPAMLVRAWQRGLRPFTGPLLLGLTPLIAWELFSLAYYGSLVPNAALAELAAGVPRLETLRQGVLYFYSTLVFDPLTLALLAAGGALALRHPDRRRPLLLAGGALYCAYVLWIGGDSMTGRFLTAPLHLAICLGLMSITRPPAAATVGLGAVALAATHPLSPLYADGDYHCNDFRRIVYGITDERRYAYASTGLLHDDRELPPPDLIRTPDYARARHVVGLYTLGYMSLGIGREIHVVHPLALTDPFLARRPWPGNAPFRPRHLERDIPPGYVSSLDSGVNRLHDPALAAELDRVWLITRGPLWSRERWRAIASDLLRHSPNSQHRERQ